MRERERERLFSYAIYISIRYVKNNGAFLHINFHHTQLDFLYVFCLYVNIVNQEITIRWLIAGQISDTSSILSGPDALSRMDLIAIRTIMIRIGRSVTMRSATMQNATDRSFFIIQMQSSFSRVAKFDNRPAKNV